MRKNTTPNAQPLIDYVQRNNIPTPIKLEIGLDKLNTNYPQTRYFRIKINGFDVTSMVALALGRETSKARGGCNGALIVHGGGMDMGFDTANRVYSAVYQAGFPNMFDDQNYTYLGQRKSNGTYMYEK